MSPENLKQIVELIQSLGGDTKEVFITYIALAFGLDFVINIVWVGVVCFVISRAAKVVLGFSLANQLNIMSGGGEWCMYGGDRDRILKVFKKGLQQNKLS